MVRRRRHPMFKGRHFDQEMIILCVRWYVTYKLSYRDLAAMMLERGISVAPSTIFRWVQRYVPEFAKRWDRNSRWLAGHGVLTRPTSRSRVSGATCIERSTSRDVPSTSSCVKTAASLRPKRSSGRHSRSHPNRPPRKVTLDGHWPSHRALRLLRREHPAWRGVHVRTCAYLNNVVEQDHRAIKARCGTMRGFKSFTAAATTLAGMELAHRIRKRKFICQPKDRRIPLDSSRVVRGDHGLIIR